MSLSISKTWDLHPILDKKTKVLYIPDKPQKFVLKRAHIESCLHHLSREKLLNLNSEKINKNNLDGKELEQCRQYNEAIQKRNNQTMAIFSLIFFSWFLYIFIGWGKMIFNCKFWLTVLWTVFLMIISVLNQERKIEIDTSYIENTFQFPEDY
ncbi:hypothetical protein ACOME3_001308 [Neoechinorhynchus agilis]